MTVVRRAGEYEFDDDPDGRGAHFRWMLHTADAHGLYERFGFAAPDHTYLERPARRPG